jgi:hypothetical protein
MTVLLDELTLAQTYAAVDIVSGELDTENTRTGLEIMMTIIDGLEDVFVNEGMKRDALLEYVPPMDPPIDELPPVEDPVDPPVEDPIDPELPDEPEIPVE